jgi:hypothetical protein
MVKHLRFKYGLIGAGIFQTNNAYVDSASLYNNKEIALTNSYGHISDADDQKIRDLVADRGLLLNNITYRAAYIYSVNHNLINPNLKNQKK